MKSKSLIIALFLFVDAFSQSSLETSYNAVYNGRNISLAYKNGIKNLNFSAGLKYHINRPEMVPIGSFFKNSATAQNFMEHFGLQIGVEYFFYKNNHCRIGVYYSNQFSKMAETHKMYYVLGSLVENPQSEFDYAYTKHEKIFGPVISFDNTMGIVVEANLTNQIYLLVKGGLGMMFWKNTDSSVLLFSNPHQRGYNFDSFGSLGLGYKFSKKSDK